MNLKVLMKNVLFYLMLFTITCVSAQNKYDFAVYFDTGAWEDGTKAFEQFLDWKGLSHKRVDAQYVNTHNLQTHFKGIYFPGGDADYYYRFINYNGVRHIKQLVANGYYIGMCAGADYACDKLTWEGITYDYPLDFFQGTAVGPIDVIAPWPQYTMTTIAMDMNDEINKFGSATEDMLYWGGSTFSTSAANNFDVVARYANAGNQSAIIKFDYENGRVLLIGPHPEIEEDNYRDHTSIVEELDDNGSDWNFLWTATDWLLKRPVSVPNDGKTIKLYPNPATDIVYINMDKKIEEITVINQQGQIVLRQKTNQKYIDISELSKGIYLIKLKTFDEFTIKKLVVQ